MRFHNPSDHDYPRGTLIHVHPMNTANNEQAFGEGFTDPLPGLPEKCVSEGNKPTERAPMLSDDELLSDMPESMVGNVRSFHTDANGRRETTREWSVFDVRDFYENLITRGELVAVGTIPLKRTGSLDHPYWCEKCQSAFGVMGRSATAVKHCPSCLSRIVG